MNTLLKKILVLYIFKIQTDLNWAICGLPQDSILGPLLHTIYFKDFPFNEVILFADDTTLSISNKTTKNFFIKAS